MKAGEIDTKRGAYFSDFEVVYSAEIRRRHCERRLEGLSLDHQFYNVERCVMLSKCCSLQILLVPLSPLRALLLKHTVHVAVETIELSCAEVTKTRTV